MPAEQRAALPVLLITGGLGAGKTTLVKALLPNHSDVKGAILVCPFGEGNDVDGTLLRLLSGFPPRPVYSLSGDESDDEDDFNSVVKEEIVPKRGALDLLVIEASGMADPRPMLAALGSMRGVEIESVVCVVDAKSFIGGGAATCREVVLRQVVAADILVMSKTDLLKGDAAVDEVTQAILAARTARGAGVPTILRSSRDGGITLEELLRALPEGGVGNAGAKRRRLCTEPLTPDEGGQAVDTEGYTSSVYCRPGCFDREPFERWAASLPPTVLHAKGLLMFSGLRCPVEWQLRGDRSSEFVEVPSDSSGALMNTGIELILIGRYGEGWEPVRFELALDACRVKP